MNSRQAELEARLARYHAHQHRETGALDKDFEEQATETQNDQVVDTLEAETRAELGQIAHALDRIASGAGDECEKCGVEIDPRRLQVLPSTTVCVDCADN